MPKDMPKQRPNIMYEEDRILAEQCERLERESAKAAAWVDDNRALVGRDREAQERELRRAGRLFRGCAAAARRRMCIGIFGPSQAGKSYLVSSLAGSGDGRLWTTLGPAAHDFLSEINPAGGKESTGLVTRFTLADPAPSPVPGDFSVHLRLLSPIDLVKILANTYFSDAEHMDSPDREAVLAELDRLEGRAKSAPCGGITPDDVEEVQEYIHKYFRGKARVQQLLDRHFWTRAIPLAPVLDDTDRARLFGLIWDAVPAFTSLLEALFGALRQLAFAPEAFCGAEALIPRERSIIDVATLGDLSPEGGGGLALVTAGGGVVSLPRAYVAALTAELVIPMREQPADFFAHTDLLDFPGYRSRRMFVDLAQETQDPDKLKECFLRGKVAYLFERYCAERELTSLLLCIGSGVQEVQGLGGAVNDWIAGTHGAAPERRSGKKTALFFILTKGDMEFEDKAGAKDVSERWDTRLYASMELFSSYGWLRQWDGKGPFANFFLMRNPTVTCHLFDHDEDGREVALKPDMLAYVGRFEAAFMQSPLVNDHIAFKNAAWQAFLAPNDGGLSLIREQLAPICKPELKREQIRTVVEEQLVKLRERLGAYWKPDDKEEERKRKDALAQQLARAVLGLAQPRRFGALAKLLTLRDQEVYDLYFQARHQMRAEPAAAPAGRGGGAAFAPESSVDDMLADILGAEALLPSPQRPASPGAKSAAQPGDEARAFGEHIEQYWLAKLRAHAEDPALQHYFAFPPSLFSQLVHELGVGFARLGARQVLEEELRKASRYANVEQERLIWKQAGLAAEVVNAYVDWLGFNPLEHGERERAVSFGGRERVLFSPPPEAEGLPRLTEDPVDYTGGLVMDWAAALIHLVRENVNFDGDRDFDPAQNSRLHTILTALGL